jgi:hypothetical protein
LTINPILPGKKLNLINLFNIHHEIFNDDDKLIFQILEGFSLQGFKLSILVNFISDFFLFFCFPINEMKQLPDLKQKTRHPVVQNTLLGFAVNVDLFG